MASVGSVSSNPIFPVRAFNFAKNKTGVFMKNALCTAATVYFSDQCARIAANRFSKEPTQDVFSKIAGLGVFKKPESGKLINDIQKGYAEGRESVGQLIAQNGKSFSGFDFSKIHSLVGSASELAKQVATKSLAWSFPVSTIASYISGSDRTAVRSGYFVSKAIGYFAETVEGKLKAAVVGGIVAGCMATVKSFFPAKPSKTFGNAETSPITEEEIQAQILGRPNLSGAFAIRHYTFDDARKGFLQWANKPDLV